MCCFSKTVESVSATQIFARFDGADRQFLVYSMHLVASQELAMVLPLPVMRGSGEGALQFIDLHGYPDFFDHLRAGFPVPRPRFQGGQSREGTLARTLEVVSVGSFDASFVPTMADFSRLDPRFQLPDTTWAPRPEYLNYGFAVFKLKPGKGTLHPMAFSFPRDRGELFFPTVHVHDGKIHHEAGFDHALYYQSSVQRPETLLRWEKSPEPAKSFMKIGKTKGIVVGDQHCFRLKLGGMLPNQDTWA